MIQWIRLKSLYALTMGSIVMLLCGCGDSELPIHKIQQSLQDVPTYSVILDDMNVEGNFFSSYLHKYKILKEDEAKATDWFKVPKDYYYRNEPFLGMALVSQNDGQQSDSVAPAGYHFVGDTRYGTWRTDLHGGSFWEFYGKYRLFSDVVGAGFARPIYTHDYNSYRELSGRNIPYYGPNNEYGTNGSITQKAKPNFFQRRMASESMKKSSFSEKVSGRIGRTSTGLRSRSSSGGK